MEPMVFIVLFAVCVSIVLLIIFVPVIIDKKARNDVMTFDTLSKNYSYLLNCSQENAIDLLSKKSEKDILNYLFDQNAMIIQFEHSGVTVDYQLSFYTIDNKTYLRATKMNLIHESSNIPFMINRFFIEKIGAEPVDYYCFEKLTHSSHE